MTSLMKFCTCKKHVQQGGLKIAGLLISSPLESHVPCFQERVDTGRLK